MAITEKVVRDDKSAPYLQRKHHELEKTGFTTAVHSRDMKCDTKVQPEVEGIFKKITATAKEALDYA